MLGSVPSGYLNLFVDYDKYSDTPIEKTYEILAAERGLTEDAATDFRVVSVPSMDDLVGLAIDCSVPVVSTTFGLLRSSHIEALKAHQVQIMTTVNSVYEIGLAVKSQKPDVLIYQNALAGGHKGGFTSLLHSCETAILDAVKEHDDVHCVLSGATVTSDDVAGPLEAGFDGVQIGTAFLATEESSANEAYKAAILENRETAFTTAITAKTARGLKNRIGGLGIKENLGFPYMHYATAPLRKEAKAKDNTDYQSL